MEIVQAAASGQKYWDVLSLNTQECSLEEKGWVVNEGVRYVVPAFRLWTAYWYRFHVAPCRGGRIPSGVPYREWLSLSVSYHEGPLHPYRNIGHVVRSFGRTHSLP